MPFSWLPWFALLAFDPKPIKLATIEGRHGMSLQVAFVTVCHLKCNLIGVA